MSTHRRKVRTGCVTAPRWPVRLTTPSSEEAQQASKVLTPAGAYLSQEAITSIAPEHGVDMIEEHLMSLPPSLGSYFHPAALQEGHGLRMI